jgi:hypothetical protein
MNTVPTHFLVTSRSAAGAEASLPEDRRHVYLEIPGYWFAIEDLDELIGFANNLKAELK